jgi:hypothetical protein
VKHKSFSPALFPGLLVLSILTACGSSSNSGDSTYSSAGSAPLAAGNFTRTVDLGTATTGNVIPFWTVVYTRAQYLYIPGEVKGSGRMTALRFRRSATLATATSCPGLTVRLGHTNLAALTTTFASNVNTGQGAQVAVINNVDFTIPAGATGEWIDIPLQVPFDYNGVDNLVVDFEKTIACSQDVAVQTQPAINMRVETTTAGSATGTVDSSRNMAQFVFAGGEAKIDFGGAGSNFWPFANTAVLGNEGPRIQNLYLASEINGSGLVTGVAFQLNLLSPGGSYTYALKLGHSTLSSLGSNFANNYSGSPTTAASAVSFTIPANIPAGEWVWVPIPDGAFTYNGTDNLLVEVATSAGTADTTFRVAGIAGRRVSVNDPTGTATTGTVGSTAYHLMLRFNGGPVSVVTAGGASTPIAFATSANGGLNLYRAAELGTAGSIRSVGCRMASANSSAASYANYQIIIGHSNLDSLVATSASDFVSQTIALSGTVFVPPGLAAGDWIELPLTTPFAYDGKSNLAIWMGTTAASGAAGSHSCRLTSSAARYPNQIAGGLPGAATVGPANFKFDMKLNISR